MKRILPIKNLLFLLFIISSCFSAYSQIKNSFDIRWNNNDKSLRGDMMLIGNNIVSRNSTAAYTGTSSNDNSDMVWVDTDNDNSTRNSSSAKLNIPNINCSDIEYAGLYWSATYRYENGNIASSQRFEDWNTVKFKVPGGTYVTLTADDVMYNGFADADQTDVTHGPYSCYKDVTTLLQAIALPNTANGNYFVANIRVSQGGRTGTNGSILGGVSGGWSLVVVYKNSSLPSKSITTFDGHAVIKTGLPTPLDIHVTGFKTRPFPEPVNSRIGVIGLEGDFGLNGDQFNIKSDNVPTNVPPFVAPGFTNLSNPGFASTAIPPLLNYFNSSISLNGTALNAITDRNPNSKNTLGWDQHLNRIVQNTNLATPPINPIIPNNCEGVTLQLRTNQDKYDVFFASFDVEVIAPEIPLTKTVNNLSFQPSLNNATLQLGQEFYYGLAFENIGNDNAKNVVITDVLPLNIIFPSVGTIINPTDVLWNGAPMPASWYTYNFTTKTFVFTFPPSVLFPLGGSLTDNVTNRIYIKVRSPLTCNDVVDACSNIVINQAYITYKGDINTEFVSDPTPSGNGTSVCSLPTPGATNYLLDVTLCDFTKTEILCGTTLLLTAPTGYNSYSWTNASGVQIGTGTSITVNAAGVYQVFMNTDKPCKPITQTITVINFNGNVPLPNPVIPFASEVVTCTNNGIVLPKIYLCGINDFKFIQTGITGATGIVWDKLVACGTLTNLPVLCPNTSSTCSWTNVATGANFTANTAGEYRITVYYQNGCFREYYFNVYKNVLNPTISPKDIVCNTPGSITVTNITAGYEYSLSPTGPFSTNPVLPVTVAGNYTVYIRQVGITGACLFNFPFITINNKQISVAVVKTNKLCNNGFGSIKVQINNVNPQYTYQLSQGATIIQTVGPINVNDYTFQNLNPGTYTVTSSTNQGCLDVQTVVIENLSSLLLTASVSQNITCTQGNIQLNPSGGQPPYSFAIYSYNGTVVNPANYAFQSSVIFDIQIGQQGNYQFVMVDNNNCTTLSNPVTIDLEPPIAFSEVHTNVTCNGLNNGTITMSTGALNGYNVTYSIDGINFQASNVFTSLAPGNYIITVKFKKGNRECSYTTSVTITQPQVLLGVSELIQQKTCLVNGSIQAINVIGGTTPYQYSINGTTYQNSNVFPNLAVGTYTIIIRDAKLCTYTTLPISITDALAPTDLTFTNTALTCPSLTTTITSTVVGGTAPFTLQIIAPSIINSTATTGTSATFANLASGTYTIKVTDSKGCTYQENKTIDTVIPITINGNIISNVTCFNTATGTASFTVSGFNTTYSYSLNNAFPVLNQTATTIALNNLNPGNYTIVVTDNQTNCTASKTITVNGPVAQLQLAIPFTPKTCVSNGSLNASATGGWGSYQYTLTLPNGTLVGPQNTGVFGGLSQTGLYTIKVKDANNCEVSNTFTINPFVSPTLTISPTSDLCYDSTNFASITVTAVGGTPPYQYQINSSALQSGFVFNNLTPNTYTIKVIDNYGCEASVTQIINPALTAQAILDKAIDCSATPAANINVTITGGLSAYQYQIKFNGGAWGSLINVTGTTFNNSTAIAGTYQFQITDSKGCVFVTNIITIAPISNPNIISITQTPPNCDGQSNGTLTVNINPVLGTGPFTYNINNGAYQSGNVFTPLAAGTYTVGVKDAKQCLDTETVILLQPNPLSGQSQLVQDLTCVITTGTIQAITVAGGTAPYEYSINGTTFVNNPIFSGLAAGTYTIIIKDAKNCTISTSPITLTVPAPPTNLTFTTSAVTCPSLTSTITATVIGGNTPYTFQIIAPTTINATTTVGNTATFTNLVVGTYTIKVTDSKGCTYQENKTINAISQISVIGNATNVKCFGTATGSATFTVSGFSTTYSYSINSASEILNQNSGTIPLTNLLAGTYTIIVTDETTNCTDTMFVTVQAPTSALTMLFPFTPKTCITNGSLNASASGGWGSLQFTLTNPDLSTVGPQNTGVFTNLSQTGIYTIKVDDANNCEVSNTFTINPTTNPQLVINTVASNLCISGSNGASITVTASNGTPGYQYQINGGQLQNSPTFNNLIAGTYIIKVIDSFGCEATVTQIINPALTGLATLTKALDCTATPSANINVTIAGGLAAFQYQIKFNGGAWGSLTNVTGTTFSYSTSISGTYQFQITDAAGCVFVTNIITIAPLSNPDITGLVISQPILCNGNNSGEIIVSFDTGLGTVPFKYQLNGGAFQTSNVFSNLVAGTYTVVMKDANECSDTQTITITQPAIVDFNLTKTDLTCSGTPGGGSTLGSITVSNVVGGTLPYEYILRNITFQVIATYTPITNENYTFPNVDFGNYSVEVIDVNGCSKIKYITIASPPNSLISTNATSNCLTGGTVDVTVLAIVPGSNYEFGILVLGDAPYANSFQPANVLGGTVSTFTGLTAGLSYTFVVHDITSDCYFIQNVPTVIPPSSTVIATLGVVQNITCTGSANGNVSFSMTNFSNVPTPTTSVSYQIFESVTNTPVGLSGSSTVSGPSAVVSVPNFGVLPYGSYYVLITENGGCTATSPIFTILESTNLLEVNATLVQDDNCTTNGGVISALGQYGTTPYTFQITSSAAIAPTAASLAWGAGSTFNIEAGSYIVYVKDTNNCIKGSNIINVANIPPPIVGLTLPFPCVNDGLFEVNVSVTNDNFPPFTYTLDSNQPIAINVANFTISNLLSGLHTIRFTDANGCYDEEIIDIKKNLSGSVVATNQPSCTTGGSIDADAINGSGSYSFILLNALGATIQGTNNDGIFTGLGFGNYTVIVTDATLNCTIPLTISLDQPIPVTLLPTTKVNPKCNGDSNGSITVNLAPGNNNTPYTYVLIATGFTTVTQIGNPVFTGLSANTYTITVTSERGCIATDVIPLVAPSLLTIDANAPDFACVSGTNNTNVVTISITQPTVGGTGPYLYSFDGSNYSNITTFDVIDTGLSYDITAYVKDANGCIASDLVPIQPLVKITSVAVAQIDALSCSSAENISITITGGVGPFTYQLLPSTTPISVVGNLILTNLTASGSYVYQINDIGTGCSVTTTPYTIAPLDVLSVVATAGNLISCIGDTSNFTFVVNGYNGSYSYTILKADGTTQSSGTNTTSNNPLSIPGLVAGSYSVSISIPNTNSYVSCSATSNVITLSQPTLPFSVQLVATNDSDCGTTGTIMATGSGGTAPYQYQLTTLAGAVLVPFQSNGYFQNLQTGTYIINIKDSVPCPIATNQIFIGLDPSPLILLELVNPCINEGLFEIKVTRTQDGIAQYSYEIDGNVAVIQNTTPFTISNLLSGSHSVTITDANGCGETKTLTIKQTLSGNVAVVSQPSCTNNDGEIDANAINGSGNYSFVLQNSGGVQIGIANNTGTFTGLGFGNYTVIVTDTDLALNCSIPLAISLEQPTPVLFTTTFENPKCNGDFNGSISAVLAASNNNAPYTYTLTATGFTTVTQIGNPIFSGLGTNNYSITVKSNRGCELTLPVNLVAPSILSVLQPTATAFACSTNNTVNVSTITVPLPSGGTAPYLYSIDGTNFGTQNTFDVVDNGLVQPFTITVKDFNNCITTASVSIQPLPTFTVAVAQGINKLTCSTDEDVEITLTSVNPIFLSNYTYQLLPSGAILPVTSNPILTTLTEPGSYVYQIIDTSTGCSKVTSPYTITPLQIFDVVATAGNPLNCFGDTNGTLTAIVNGYTGNFTYDIVREDGTIFLSGSNNPISITGLSVGNYTVKVMIPNTNSYVDCTKISNVINISSPPIAIGLVVSQTSNVTCDNNAGTIVAEGSGGTLPYLYQLESMPSGTVLTAFSGQNSFINLAAGNYKVKIKDANNCATEQLITLLPTVPITIINPPTIVNQLLQCYNGANASVTITGVSGGQGSYQYTLTNTTTGNVQGPITTNTFTDLAVGNYSVLVTDGWGCSYAITPFSINQPTEIVATLATSLAATCTSQAQVTISATGGTPPYKYSVDNVTYNTTNTFTVAPGTYQYYVTDANNCKTFITNPVTIYPVVPVELDLNEDNTALNCAGDTNASVTATATFGLGNYKYSLLDSSSVLLQGPQDSGLFFGPILAPGNYFIKVTGGGGICDAIKPFTITVAPELVVPAATVVNVLCNGDNTGSITINASGGTVLYQYGITPNVAQTSNVNQFTNLYAGTYSVLVQDANGCYKTIPVTIREPATLTLNSVEQQELCTGAGGSSAITITGGTAPYYVSFNNETSFIQIPSNGNQYTIPNITGGQDYTIYIKDANGCTTDRTITMTAPVTMTPQITPVTYGCTTSSSLLNNTVTVSILETAIVSQVQYSLDNTTSYQGSGIFTNLTNGLHTIYVKHSNGCEKIISVTISNPLPLAATKSKIDVKCFGDNTGSITLSGMIGGSGNYQFAISPNFIFGSASSFTGLVAGTYTIKMKDVTFANCETSFTETILNTNALIEPKIELVDQPICFNDGLEHIQISITGGVAPYSTSLNGTTNYIANQFDFYTNLNIGTTPNVIYVKDALGCEKQISVIINAGVILNPIATPAETCINNIPTNSVTVSMTPNYGDDVQYSINNGSTYQPSNVFSNLPPGNYTVKVLHDNGCSKSTAVFNVKQLTVVQLTVAESGLNQITATATLGQAPYNYEFNGVNTGENNVYFFTQSGNQTVKVYDSNGCFAQRVIPTKFYDIEIPNFFTPNGSGQNDGWTPLKIDNLKNIKTSIFDRYGRELKVLYNGDQWDGTYRGNEVPSGDYWYLVEVNDDTGRTFVGNFTLYR
jgi:large repetitive protein